MTEAQSILKEALSERVAANRKYSLRAFARDMGLSPQQLSNVINGRRGLSIEMAQKIASKLGLSDFERTTFLESLRAKFARSQVQKSIAQEKLKSLHAQGPVKNLEIDLFKIISSWHHFALVELIKISTKKTNKLAWFSKRLSISENEVLSALGRLERLQLITKTRSGWSVNQDVMIADHAISSEAVKKFHKQLLEKSIQALAFQTQNERYGSSSTLPIRVKNIDRAKKMIQEFRLAFDREISDTENGEEIYGLSLQFFRLTEKETSL